MLAIDRPDLARGCIQKRPKNAWYKRHQILERVTWRRQNDNAKRGADEILLELKIPIGRQEDFKTRVGGAPQELAVAEPRPALLLDRADVMAEKFLRELSR
jgi:hypothetical protein